MLALLLALAPSYAANLDLIEVGGAWGSPGATDATAVYWNPAGLAAGKGTQITLELAPTFASVEFDRKDPNYGGIDNYRFSGVVPFIGVSSDLFLIDNLGVGFGLSVPVAHGAKSPSDVNGGVDADKDGITDAGPGAFALRDGGIQTLDISAGISYDILGKVSLGLSGHFLDSTFNNDVDNEISTTLQDGICEIGFCGYYDNPGQIENQSYAARVKFDNLKARAFTFGAGINVHPIDKVAVSVAYIAGARLDHTGPANIKFGCPPQSDFYGRLGAESRGLCDSSIDATAGVGLNLPNRLHGAVVLKPIDAVRLELMGGWVGWSTFTDYDITTTVEPDAIPIEPSNPDDPDSVDNAKTAREGSAEDLSQNRKWARDSQDTMWVGLDAKGFLLDEKLTLGGRFTYDQASIPTAALSPNNYDANTFIMAGLVGVRPVKAFEIGLSFSHQFLAERVNKDSAFLVALDPENRPLDRYDYPQMNGTYNSGINRVGISLRGYIDGAAKGD